MGKQVLFGKMVFGHKKFFWPKDFFWLKKFLLAKNFFLAKGLCLEKGFLWPRIFLGKKHFLAKRYFPPKENVFLAISILKKKSPGNLCLFLVYPVCKSGIKMPQTKLVSIGFVSYILLHSLHQTCVRAGFSAYLHNPKIGAPTWWTRG